MRLLVLVGLLVATPLLVPAAAADTRCEIIASLTSVECKRCWGSENFCAICDDDMCLVVVGGLA